MAINKQKEDKIFYLQNIKIVNFHATTNDIIAKGQVNS